MLLNELSTGLVVGCVLLLLLALILFVQVWRLSVFCRSAIDFVTTQNKNAVSLRRMADVELALTDLKDSYEALLEGHKKLRSRIGMRKVRSDSKNVVDLSSSTDKEAIRAKLKQEGRL